MDRLKIQISNFGGRLTLMNVIPKSEKLVKSGRSLGHMTYFLIVGLPNISGTAEAANLKFCMQIDLRDT